MMIPSSEIAKYQEELQALVGLKLAPIVRRAANMRGFHFGKLTKRPQKGPSSPHPKPTDGWVGEYKLHLIGCWRLIREDTLITGSNDIWAPTDDNPWHEAWDYHEGNLQDELLEAFFAEHRDLHVLDVEMNHLGDLDIHLSEGHRIQSFSTSLNRGDEWVFFSDSVFLDMPCSDED